MVDSSLIIAVIGVGGTIFASGIGAYINIQNTRTREENENYRTVADYYMEKKTEELLKLYEVTSDVSFGFVSFVLKSREDPSKSVNAEKMIEYLDEVEQMKKQRDKCRVFLNSDQESATYNCTSAIQTVRNCIYQDDHDSEYYINWDEVERQSLMGYQELHLDTFRKHTRIVQDMIDNEINEPIEELYDEIGGSYKGDLTDEMIEYADAEGEAESA